MKEILGNVSNCSIAENRCYFLKGQGDKAFCTLVRDRVSRIAECIPGVMLTEGQFGAMTFPQLLRISTSTELRKDYINALQES